jgi:hypothetical protein
MLIFFIKRSFCNTARSEVKSKTVIRSHTISNVWYKGSCYLDQFGINISCKRPKAVTLLWLDENSHVGTTRFTARQFFLISTSSFRLSCDYNA